MIELLGRVVKEASKAISCPLGHHRYIIGPATLISVPERSTGSMGRWVGHAFESSSQSQRESVCLHLAAGDGAYMRLVPGVEFS